MIKIGSPTGRAIILMLALVLTCGSFAFAQKSTTTNDQDTPPIAGDSGFTSPLSGRNVGAGSDEQQFFSDLLDEYHQMKVAEENLNYAKLCGSKQDIDKAEAELKDETDEFNKLLEKYIYSVVPNPNIDSSRDTRNHIHEFLIHMNYGDPALSGDPKGKLPRTDEQQMNYNSAVNKVMAALAKEDKPVPRHSGCGDQAVTTPPLPPKPKDHPSPPPPGGNAQLVNTLIGVVMPTDTRAGDQVSATVVTNPKAYEGVPGLQVVQATLPLTRDAQGVATLSGVVVETSDNKLQSAQGGILVEVARNSEKLTMQFLTDGSDTPVAEQVLQVGTGTADPPTWPPSEIQQLPTDAGETHSTVFKVKGPPDPKNWEPSSVQRIQVDKQPHSTVMKLQGPREPKIWNPSEVQRIHIPAASSYTTPPVYNGGNVQVIQGPVSGDSVSTQVLLDNQPAKIVAESPRALYFKLPENTTPGAHTVLLKEGGLTLSSFHVAVIWLKLSADLLALKRGQSTAMHATILGAEAIPASAWRMGIEKDLVDSKEAGAMVLASTGSEWCWLRGCSPDKPGVIALSIVNNTMDTVALSDAKGGHVTKLLGKESFSGGPYTFNGKIKSFRDGTFDINVRVIPLLAPIEGEAAQ